MLPSKRTCIVARKKCIAMAEKILKVPHFFTEPLPGVVSHETTYIGSALVELLNYPAVQAIQIPQASLFIVPMVWNYLDAAASLTTGIHQLMDEDNYRQTQTKIKGLLDIIAAAELFVFTFNPPLIMALGIAGGPAVLATAAFAVSILIDTISSAIDYYNAVQESDLHGWLKERSKELAFISKRLHELADENFILGLYGDDSIIKANQEKIKLLESRRDNIEADIKARYLVHKNEISDKELHSLGFKRWLAPLRFAAPSSADLETDSRIQKSLDAGLRKTREKLIVNSLSFVGVSLFAVGTFAAMTACPPAIALTGLAITVVVASIYLYRHQAQIAAKFGKFKESVQSSFNSDKEPDSSPTPAS